MSDTATTDTTDTTTTATQARVLALLRSGGAVWADEELVDQLAAEAQVGAPALAEQVPEAIAKLLDAKLAHRIGRGLLTVSRKGERGGASAESGSDELHVAETGSGPGVLERVDEPNRIIGGAEDLDLEPTFGAGG